MPAALSEDCQHMSDFLLPRNMSCPTLPKTENIVLVGDGMPPFACGLLVVALEWSWKSVCMHLDLVVRFLMRLLRLVSQSEYHAVPHPCNMWPVRHRRTNTSNKKAGRANIKYSS